MSSTTVDEWRADLRRRLVVAMKARDSSAVAALRATLSAIDNAEAADALDAPAVEAGVIAGGVAGLGAGEVARRQLDAFELRSIVGSEVTQRRSAATEYRQAGQEDRAATLEAEAAVIERFVRDTP